MLGVLSVGSMKLMPGGWTGPPPVSAAAARRQSPGRSAREPVLCAEQLLAIDPPLWGQKGVRGIVDVQPRSAISALS